mgnify:FL=1
MNDIEIQYIGACALLGRLSRHIMDAEERDLIKRAMDDCVESFHGRFEVIGTNVGGWSLEPKKSP